MIKFSAFYPIGNDVKFDFEYYISKHMELTGNLLGDALKRVEVDKGISGAAGAAAPYRAIGHLYYESMDSFRRAMMPHLESLRKDISIFTNVQPLIQISEVVI